MIHKYNIAELSLVDRPIQSQKAGFGSVIPQHSAGHDRRYFQTENRDFYGETAKISAVADSNAYKQINGKNAAGHIRPMDEQSTRVISNMTGEIFDKEHDPQSKTDVQRSWLYQQDPAVGVINQGNARMKQENMFDNANSLPMGSGMASHDLFKDGIGAYGKKKTDITPNHNLVFTRK